MLLSKIPDFKSGYDKMTVEVKNHKFYFSINGDKHVMGSKLYPVGKRGLSFFTGGTTTKGDFQEVEEYLERENWKHKNGYCYTNAETLHKAFLEHKINAKYYSGWLFVNDSHPIHHAWVSVDGNVYDIGIHETSQQHMRNMIMDGKDVYHPRSIRELKEIEKTIFPLRDNFIWGKVPDYMMYIGAEDTPNGARVKYNSCVNKVDFHPSYKNMTKGKGDKHHFQTRMQTLLND